jgi:hypothetical protein
VPLIVRVIFVELVDSLKRVGDLLDHQLLQLFEGYLGFSLILLDLTEQVQELNSEAHVFVNICGGLSKGLTSKKLGSKIKSFCLLVDLLLSLAHCLINHGSNLLSEIFIMPAAGICARYREVNELRENLTNLFIVGFDFLLSTINHCILKLIDLTSILRVGSHNSSLNQLT